MEPKQKAQAEAKAALIQKYLNVFDSPDGQEVLLDLMEKGYLLKPLTGVVDRESAINEGKRELLLYIMDMISYDVASIMDIIGSTEKSKDKQGETDEKEEFDFFKD